VHVWRYLPRNIVIMSAREWWCIVYTCNTLDDAILQVSCHGDPMNMIGYTRRRWSSVTCSRVDQSYVIYTLIKNTSCSLHCSLEPFFSVLRTVNCPRLESSAHMVLGRYIESTHHFHVYNGDDRMHLYRLDVLSFVSFRCCPRGKNSWQSCSRLYIAYAIGKLSLSLLLYKNSVSFFIRLFADVLRVEVFTVTHCIMGQMVLV